MATVTHSGKLGPLDHGRPMTLDEFMAGDYQEGYQYELIDGRLYVSPLPNLPQGRLERWIFLKLLRHSDDHPEVINFVYGKCRVFVPGRKRTTCPEPDVTAYRDFPLDEDFETLRWQDVSPVLVVEVLSLDDPAKDLVRNVELYLEVPSLKEYWVIDSRESADRPTMTVYRRRGHNWQKPIRLAFRDRYTTKLLPGFELIVDPRR
jgi:Uma2 family endonuclease